MRGLTSGIIAISFLGICSPPAHSQSPAPLAQYAALQDTLAHISDSSRVRDYLEHARDKDFLERGLIALRLAEVGADPSYRLALTYFRSATERTPDRPEPWYGLGLAEAGRSHWEMGDRLRLGSRVGLGSLERSATDHARALSLDPHFVPAALALARTELTLLDTLRIRRARDLLRQVIAITSPAPSDLLLSWGQLERAAGALDSADVAFERYLSSGGDRALGLLELARARLAAGRPDGDGPYYEGAALDDPQAVAGYRADLGLIAADSVLTEFDRLEGQSRSAFLHRFWTDRDHLELRPEGERLREHYRRVQYARTHFPLTISRRFYGASDAFRSGNIELDDRGVIYVRQGEPTQRIRPFIFRAMPNESWRYQRGDGDLLFHFSSGYDNYGGGDLYDYRLVESVLDLHGAEEAPRDQLLLSRQSLSPIYSRMLNWGPYGAANEAARERNIGATSIAVGTTTDSYELTYPHRLPALADLLAIGRMPQGTRGHFVFGIAAAGITPQRTSFGVEYPVRVRVVALDRYDRAVARLDTVIVVRHDRVLKNDEFVVGRAELELPAGRWSYRAALQVSDSLGVVLPRDSVRVATTDPRVLSITDIAMGTPGRSVPWTNDQGDTVFIAPSKLFRRGADLGLYYEVTGATAGRQYRHDISVLRAGRGDPEHERPLVSLSFEEAAPGELIRSRRLVRMNQLKAGDYLVQVIVTGADGSSQTRRRAIRLIDK